MRSNRGLRVDIHSHVLLEAVMGRAAEYGPELLKQDDGSVVLRVGDYRTRARPGDEFLLNRRLWDADARLEDMDRLGIDVMGITISPLFYLYWAEPEIGVPFARIQNDALAEFCRHSPERFFAMSTLPMQDVEASIQELKRCTVDLETKGINLGTDDLGGRELDDPALWPLYEEVQALELPLFLHPYPSPLSHSTAPDRYNLSWITGYIAQETDAFTRLVLGGVLDAFPALKICLPHGGGMLPYQFGRLEYAAARMPDVKAQRPPREYLSNFYFDILVHDPKAREFLVDFAGPDQLVVGDNYSGWDHVDGFALLEELPIPEASKEKIRGENARRLFRLGE